MQGSEPDWRSREGSGEQLAVEEDESGEGKAGKKLKADTTDIERRGTKEM